MGCRMKNKIYLVGPKVDEGAVIYNKPGKTSMYTSTSSPSSRKNFLNSMNNKSKGEIDDGKKSLIDDLRLLVFDLLNVVEVIKREHGKELGKLRRELEEEKAMRSILEVEVEKLKKLVLCT